jgi:hypothetical protein
MAFNFYSTTGFTSQETMRITTNGNIGIGSGAPNRPMDVDAYNEWNDILKLAETNPAVKSAFDKLRITYYLSKDNGNKEKA